jgi:hypothetical protein
MALTDEDRRILEFEGSWWKRPEPKAVSIRAELKITPTAFYRRLCLLVDDEDAMAYMPLVVRRLQKRRSERRKERFEGIAEPQHPRR